MGGEVGQVGETAASAEADFDHRVRVVQSKVQTFVKACGGSVPLRALRMYIETQERNDAIISRAVIGACDAGQLVQSRSPGGTPLISLVHRPDCPAVHFRDYPERCRCDFMAMLDRSTQDPAS